MYASSDVAVAGRTGVSVDARRWPLGKARARCRRGRGEPDFPSDDQLAAAFCCRSSVFQADWPTVADLRRKVLFQDFGALIRDRRAPRPLEGHPRRARSDARTAAEPLARRDPAASPDTAPPGEGRGPPGRDLIDLSSMAPPAASSTERREPRIFETWEGNDVRAPPRRDIPRPRVQDPAPVHRRRPTRPLNGSLSPDLPSPAPTILPDRTQRFFCDGRCMAGPSPGSLAGTCALVLVPSAVFNALVVPDVASKYSLAFVVAIAWPLWCLSCLVAAGTTDPGIVRREPYRPPPRAAPGRGTRKSASPTVRASR